MRCSSPFSTQDGVADRWLWRPSPRPNARFRLFCFPFAGGGPRAYQAWDSWLEPDVELVGVRLPGRESRLGEAAYSDWTTLLEATAGVLEPWLDRPFALFGHSFGGQIAYRLAAHWCDRARSEPEASAVRPEHPLALVAVSACCPPHCPRIRPGLWRLDRESFFAALARGGGIPPEALANEEFKRLFEPTLRADLQLAEAWHALEPGRVTAPLVAFAGQQDTMAPPDAVGEWSRYAPAGFSLTEVAGGHFFLREQAARLVETLTSRLRSGSLDGRGRPSAVYY